MTSKELRNEFLKFFEKKGHQIVPSSSLLPSDPSVLFTTAGMQQFKEYFLGKKSPFGDKVVSCQKCFRTSDIEQVGDASHLTFLEMLGNFSFGSYFKEEAIELAYEFLFKKLKLSLNEVVFTIFEGDENVPADKESILIWKKLGIPENKIIGKGRTDNLWGPTGEEGPCGPTTEIHIGGVEVWNLVFNEYYQDKTGKLTPLKQKGVDTGMGLERLAMVAQNKPSVFETDLFSPIIASLPGQNEKARRIIADHVKSAVFLIAEGILPSNVERGYVLRRILRRAIRYGKVLNLSKNFLILLAQKMIEIYEDIYPEVKSGQADILTVIQNEEEKFEKTIEKAIKILNTEINLKDYIPGQPMEPDILVPIEIDGIPGFTPYSLTGKWFFDLFQTFGFPFEIAIEELKNRGRIIPESELNRIKKEFEDELKKHQEISRAGAEQKFKGGLADSSGKTIKYHTATHLLLAALREILSPEIYQKGSNITTERLRFDFNYPQKLNEEQIKKVESLVNEKISQNITVEMVEMSKNDALKIVKISFNPDKYGERVKIYKIGDFSIELCGGPHVGATGELGRFKIIKEESSGAGIRRIRAILE